MADGITYQNKDVLFKFLSEAYKDKSLSVYGLDLPPIKTLLPTNLPAVQADEKRSDNVFLLEDDKTVLILEYESRVSADNMDKYAEYMVRVMKSCRGVMQDFDIVLAVIYTGDVKEAPAEYNVWSLRVRARQVFLSNFDGEAMYEELRAKVEKGESLTDQDIMRFIILPLTGSAGNQKIIEAAIDLAKKVEDDEQQALIIAGILTAADKFINREYSNKVKGWLRMTKVAQLYEEEKIEYANQAAMQNTREIAKALLYNGVDILTIMKSTKLSREEVEKLRDAHSA